MNLLPSSLTNRTKVVPMKPQERETNHNREDDPKGLWEVFRSSSTLHGFCRASEPGLSVRRIIWLVLLLAACGVLVTQLKDNIDEWRKHEVLFGTEIRHSKSLPFPAVSICNQNMLRKSKILGKNGQRYLDSIRDVSMRWENKTDEALRTRSGETPFDIEHEILTAGHQLNETMHSCLFNGKICSAKDFVHFFDYRHGLCYTFKSSEPISYAGLDTALYLFLDAQPDEYYGIFSDEGIGFKVAVHDPIQLPYMARDGLSIPPGFTTNVKVERKEFYRLPPPYKSRCGNRTLISSQFYSQERCEEESFSVVTVGRCGCRLLGAPKEGYESAARVCSTHKELACANLIFKAEDSENETYCPLPCEDMHYSTDVSALYFPSRSTLSEKVAEYNKLGYIDGHYYKQYNTSTELENYVETEVRKSVVQLRVYYKTLETTVVRERVAYTFTGVLADFGGNMGLFVGCSVLTLVEFLDFLVLACRARYRRRKRPRDAPTDIMT